MGIVYRAHDVMLRRTVAVKVLTPQLAADRSFVERFRHEAIAAANLRHSHIATVYDVGQDTLQGSPVHYLVMEFIEGQTLDRILRSQGQPFSLHQTDEIIGQVAQALHYAHQRGMIHRDVKPANIMVGQDGHVTLMDFGLVRAGDLSQLTQTGTALGTPAYMAPEQIMGAEVDRRTDIYALGVVIYELLTGDVPFRRTTPLAMAHAQVYDPPPPLREKRPELPLSVESVVLRALAKNPGRRHRDVIGLASDFSHAMAGQMPLDLAEENEERYEAVALSGATVQPLAPRLLRTAATAVHPPSPTFNPPPAPPTHPRRVSSPWLWVAVALAVLALGAGVLAALGALRVSPPGATVATTPSATAALAPAVAAARTVTLTAASASGSPAEQEMLLDTTTATTFTAMSTAIATSTPLPTIPTVPSAVQVEVISDVLNVRSGPGTQYKVIGKVSRPDSYQVVGRTANGAWWQICCVNGEAGWVVSTFVRTSGAIEAVPLVDAPTPTKTTTGTLAAAFELLSLVGVANANAGSGYVDPPLGEVILAGVPFDLGVGESVTTQAISVPANPRSISLPVSVVNAQVIYLLLTGGNMFNTFAGQTIGQALLVFDNGAIYPVDLKVGYNLREWKQFGQDTVTTKTSPDLSEVWRGANRHDSGPAIIDMLTIALPTALQGQHLIRIDLIDRSHEMVGSLDPAINWLGATVRTADTASVDPGVATTAPTAAQTATPTASSCVLLVGPTFARVWQRQQMGCPVSSEASVTSAYESFERGFMLWRKDVDSHFVVFDDGMWSRFTFPPVEPIDFACSDAEQLGRPRRGFSQVWCGYPDVRQRIGNALDDEIGNDRQLQVFEQGFMVFIPEHNAIYVLLDNGSWQRFE